jgi:mono/diheme cytochrome c family protein
MVRDGVMPAGGAGRLGAAQVSAIRSWIEGGAASGAQSVETATAAKVTYQDVLPVLLLRCTVCHGLRRQEGGLGSALLCGHSERRKLWTCRGAWQASGEFDSHQDSLRRDAAQKTDVGNGCQTDHNR